MSKKYELTNETISYEGKILRRIRALRDFSDVEKGQCGGFVENESNLSQEDKCWIYNNARVCGNAKILDEAIITDLSIVDDNAVISGKAILMGKIKIYDNVKIFNNAHLYGNVEVHGNARIYDNSHIVGHNNNYIRVYDNTQIYGSSFISGNIEIRGDSHIFRNASILGHIRISGGKYISNLHWFDPYKPLYKSSYDENHLSIINNQSNSIINELKEMLIESCMNAVGIPNTIMNSFNEADFAKTLELANSNDHIVSVDIINTSTQSCIVIVPKNIDKNDIEKYVINKIKQLYTNGKILLDNKNTTSEFNVNIIE